MNTSFQTLVVELDSGILTVFFNREKQKNALSLQMVDELEAVLQEAVQDSKVRAIFLRGKGKHFCAGGDIKDMAKARMGKSEGADPIAVLNRRFGALINAFYRCPKTVVAIVQGAAMGGGFGLACIADVVVAHKTAKFKLPETSLGVPPAQIAPFLVYRLGMAKAKRLALTGASITGHQAVDVGLVDMLVDDDTIVPAVDDLKTRILRCAPQASQVTKQLFLSIADTEQNALLDQGAQLFAEAVRSGEGMEGMMAFLQKRNPSWVVKR